MQLLRKVAEYLASREVLLSTSTYATPSSVSLSSLLPPEIILCSTVSLPRLNFAYLHRSRTRAAVVVFLRALL